LSGRKRHLLVDTLGLVLKAVVHPANITDREGAKLVLGDLKGRFPRMKHLWLDAGYTGSLKHGIAENLGWKAEIVNRPRRWVWVPNDVEPPPMPTGFQILPRRWVVERTFAWLGKFRRLSKDYEALTETSETMIYVAASCLMLRRLSQE
jgi:transposase